MNKIVVLGIAVAFCILALFVAINRSGSTENPEDGHNAHGAHVSEITSERSFLEHMIPHHQEAVDTARVVLERGATLRPLQELAGAIVSTQSVEIDQMKGWYQTWYEEGYEDTGVYAPMMRSLEDLSGAQLDRVFLEDMIMHHEGAILAAQKVLTVSRSAETTELANRIIVAQESEITLMRELLQLLPN